LAKALGARFHVFEVNGIYEAYEKGVEKYLERELSWDEDNLTRQNLQARVRNPSVSAIANVENRILITTSNRSEAAVGYCTMDGDTAGGLAPIAGVGKPFVLQWNAWLMRTGLKAMEAICVQTPTAELKPVEYHQTDEADLMPYPLLDTIQKAAVLEKYSPVEIYTNLRQSPMAENLSSKQLGAYIERYFKLWAANQWKRERYAPSFHLDDENLDPRSWLRFPILSGGYVRELKKLREVVNNAGNEICNTGSIA
jgi:NAD+ synthase (glutamine-hydrolysing)